MDKRLELKDFDAMGIIRLTDVEGIRDYVTPILNENGETVEYLSRSKEYYNVKNMTELSNEREALKEKLTREISRRNFVIIENMLNCSAKVYFRKLENYIANKDDERRYNELKQAEMCLMEDVRNLIVVLDNQGVITLDKNNILPQGMENAEKRIIEMDNKALVYAFAKSLTYVPIEDNVEVVIPGYGAIYIGPFLKEMYGFDFTNLLKSKYIQDTAYLKDSPSVQDMCSSSRPFEDGKKVLLVDDNVGTGETMKDIRRELTAAGVKEIMTGAIQYNWRNYYKISTGQKTGIPRFNPDEYDLITPINFAGHKFYKHAIDQLHSSGNNYINYLKGKSFLKEDMTDIRVQIERGILCSRLVRTRFSARV